MRRFPEPSLRRYTLPLAAAIGLGLALLSSHNVRLEDTLNRAAPSPLDPRIVVVNIDDATVSDYGLLHTWPRELYAAAIDTLEQAGAQVIGLDVVLGQPRQDNQTLQDTFSQSNLVLATAPGDLRPLLARSWHAQTGVSALNNTGEHIRTFQTAYPLAQAPAGGQPSLVPSFAWQVAAQAEPPAPLTLEPYLLRYTPTSAIDARSISFRDLVAGNVRFAELQGKIVLIGLNASGLAGLNFPDIDGRATPGLYLQARAVSTLLSPPLQHLPVWLTAILCVATALVAVALGGLWGYALAGAALLVSPLLWKLNVAFPGMTVSLAAVAAMGLVAFERWWQLRTLGVRDSLTGLGNRLAFTRVVEHRWPNRLERPFSLALIDLGGLRRINEVQGRAAGDALLRELAARLNGIRRRGDLLFRWGPDEFALLLDGASPQEVHALRRTLEQELQQLRSGNLPVQISLGVASTSADQSHPLELIEAASRERYRAKYQRQSE